MTYQLYKPNGSNGLNPIPVPDNAIDYSYYDVTNKVGVALVGRNAVDYGTAVAQNTIQMVSNFAGDLASIPNGTIALQGQLWFNTTSATTGLLYVRVDSGTGSAITSWERIVTEDSSGSVTFSGDVTIGGNLTVNGFIAFSVDNAVVATGTLQSNAKLLTKSINVVITVPANSGVKLPVAVAGYRIIVKNSTATDVKVYPNTGARIESNSVNAAVTLVAGGSLEYVCTTGGGSGQWYNLNATYA
jgi:hypothetical protein